MTRFWFLHSGTLVQQGPKSHSLRPEGSKAGKSLGGRGAALYPSGGAYNAPPDTQAGAEGAGGWPSPRTIPPLRYGPCVTMGSHSFTCHPHELYLLSLPSRRRHRPLAGTRCACLRRDCQAKLTWVAGCINVRHLELNPDTVTHPVLTGPDVLSGLRRSRPTRYRYAKPHQWSLQLLQVISDILQECFHDKITII